jgi:hypothetical protein
MSEPRECRPWSWREIAVVVAATIVGAMLRFWDWRSIGISHFDEGIYALVGMWSLNPGGLGALDPQIIPYAPPGLPILIGVAYRIFGDSDHAALLVAQLLGVATIPLLAWFARHAFGAGAGGAAAIFAALAGVHVTFSRMVLTDVPFLFAWLTALGAGALFLEMPTFRRAVALGFCVGLAQYFKYSGWLAGGVVGLAAVAGFRVSSAPARRQSSRTLAMLAVSASVAAVLYVPWYLFVEGHAGGYAGLVAHHRGYLKSADAWFPNLVLQLAQGVALSGGAPWGLVSWFAAWIAVAFCLGSLRAQAVGQGSWLPFWVALLGGAALSAKFPNLGWWVGLAWAPWLLVDSRPGARLAAASWVLLSVITPFYHPYARLWLPLHATGWTLLAGLMPRLWVLTSATSKETISGARKVTPRPGYGWAMSFFCVGLATYVELRLNADARPLGGVLEPSNSLRLDMRKVEGSLAKFTSRLKLLTRPPAIFYLRHCQNVQLERLTDSSALQAADSSAWALVEEIQLRQEGNFEQRLRRLFRTWDAASPFIQDLEPADLLDHHPGAALGNSGEHDQQVIWLLRPRQENP